MPLRIKRLYPLSVLIAAVLVVYIGYMALGGFEPEKYQAEVSEVYILHIDRATIKFVIRNPEDIGLNYTIIILQNHSAFINKTVYIPGKNPFQGSTEVYPQINETSEITFLVYKKGELEPVTNTTYLASLKSSASIQNSD